MRARAMWLLDHTSVELYTAGFSKGALLDVLMAGLFALLCFLSHKWRLGQFLVAASFVFLLAANNLSVVSNHHHLDITMVDEVANAGFIQAVLFTPEFFYEFISAILAVSLTFALSALLKGLWAPLMMTGIVLVFLSTNLFAPRSPIFSSWVGGNVLEENITTYLSAYIQPTLYGNEDAGKFFERDLAGEKRIDFLLPGSKPNILLITLESISKKNTQKMPYLKSLKKQSLNYTNFAVNVQKTIKGLYAILCGDHPGQKWHPSKIKTIQKDQHGRYACLPHILKEQGYHTAYMQPSWISFQGKHKLLGKVGFSDVYGKKKLAPVMKGEGFWGKPDRPLYKRALKKVHELEQSDRPWFFNVMTVSTHRPPVVPWSYMRSHRHRSRMHNAFMYADQSLKFFMNSLKRAGFLENTLVIITTDEVRDAGDTSIQKTLKRNHGILYIITPDGAKASIDQAFEQTDILLSILDYLGLAENYYANGRSVFRHYARTKPMILSHIYAKHVMFLPTLNHLTICETNLLHCSTYRATLETIKEGLFQKSWESVPWHEKWREILHATLNEGEATLENLEVKSEHSHSK